MTDTVQTLAFLLHEIGSAVYWLEEGWSDEMFEREAKRLELAVTTLSNMFNLKLSEDEIKWIAMNCDHMHPDLWEQVKADIYGKRDI